MPISFFPSICGEANTASNVGSSGIGIFKQKSGIDLQFKKLNAGSDNLTITDDIANNKIDISVDKLTLEICKDIPGTRTGNSTFTFPGSAADAKKIIGSLFTCTNSSGTIRRIGYIKSAIESSGIITVTIVSNSDLVSGDKDFKIAPNHKIWDFQHLISVPGELASDPSNPQGEWLLDLKFDSYLLPVHSALRVAATGEGAICSWNIYKNSTALFNSAQDMAGNSILNVRRPDIYLLSAGDDISMRIINISGTGIPRDLQVKLYIVPMDLITAVD
jgi:hypothetical protein